MKHEIANVRFAHYILAGRSVTPEENLTPKSGIDGKPCSITWDSSKDYIKITWGDPDHFQIVPLSNVASMLIKKVVE